MTKALINGQLVDARKALISVDERGFRFGDGVFETVPVYGGIPYLWQYHKERLEAGLTALRIPAKTGALLSNINKLIRANAATQGLVRISISRGVGSQGYLPLPDCKPLLIMQMLELPKPPLKPVALWLGSHEKISPRALPAGCKLAQGVNATLARMEAADHGCHDALQLTADGHVAEASSANIFWLKGGRLYTPSLESGALAGVTRRRIFELSPHPVKEGLYTLEALRAAEAVIITSAALGVMAVSALQPGKTAWKSAALAAQFSELRNRDITLGK